MKDLEVFYPNDDDPRKEKPDPLVEVNALLKSLTKPNEDVPTIQTLAEELEIGNLQALANKPEFRQALTEFTKWSDGIMTSKDPWSNRADVMLLRFLLVDFKVKEKEPSVFDQINSYLKKEAPTDIENPTVQGIAERMGIAEETLNNWLATDEQFKDELTRLKEFQEKDPFKEGTDFDYFVHSSGVQFVLEETKKRYEGK